ncbi:MAG: tautomerase family protein [Catenulispora sp.]
MFGTSEHALCSRCPNISIGRSTVPIVRIDLSDRRGPEQRVAVSDGVHQAFVTAVGIPEGDKFHLITVHPSKDLRADPEYLGVHREDVIFVQVTLVRGRSSETKTRLFRAIAENLARIDGVRAEDVCVVLTENGPADYSWGNGEAQLLSLESIPGVVTSAAD